MPDTPNLLPDEVKDFIVTELARYERQSEVVKAVKDRFDIDVSIQAVHRYDPTTKAGQELSERLKTHFERTRKAFLEDVSDIPVSHKAYRVRQLQKGVNHFEKIGNYVGMADLLERAAKEMGEAYTNKQKHEHTGKDGEPLPLTAPTIILTGAAQPAPAPETVDGVRKPSD